ncbi:MAG: glycosyltransferase family 2 protein [Patescibacteria group bacterium]|nr:glycosyltransferase family 2 protein [Patescibacteria group bacterium]MDE2590477.1 glycosyltransferase family 2 protein [Patescibacteria group bacterium]
MGKRILHSTTVRGRKKLKIGIIVVHYGLVQDTKECLESLQQIIPGPYSFKVFLVDNDPTNRFPSQSWSKDLPVSLITSSVNGGFAAGINLGALKALAEDVDYLLFLNNDTIVHQDLFTEILPYFSYDSSLGLLSPMLVYHQDPEKIWCTSGKVHKLFFYSTYPYMDRKLSDVRLPKVIYSDFAAAALFVKSEVIKKIGLLDEKYFLFAEDIEWCLRAQKAGYKLAYVTKPLVIHKVSATSGNKGTNNLSPLGAYLYARNFFYVLGDHHTWFNPFLAIVGQLCIRAPFYMLFRMSGFSSRKAYVTGIRDGFVYLFSKQIIPVSYSRF